MDKESEDKNNERSRKMGSSNLGQSNVGDNQNHDANESVTNEYCKQLSEWIYQCHCYNMLTTWTWMMAQTTAQTIASQQQINTNLNTTNQLPNNVNLGRIYRIPSLWKRGAAELIDFMFLLVLKLMVTYFAIDYLDIIDLDKFDLNILESDFDAVQIAYELTSEIIIIEMIHRFVVIAYESVCLHRGQLNRPGGSTPGKAMFGLVVVSCDNVVDIGHGLVSVFPARNLGFPKSLLRALIKNLSAVFFIPASLSVFLMPYNRAVYDVACKCIVVEEVGSIGNVLHAQRPRN